MKKLSCWALSLFLFMMAGTTVSAEEFQLDRSVMSDAYHALWNDEVQAQIDDRIEKYRKADATITLDGVKPGSEVRVEQISHQFIFGAHIFNFNQLGTEERNAKYRSLYGALFNSATISFYWKKFELEPGKPRFETEEWDTEAWWNACPNPKEQVHWRRPASDQVVAFCESKGIRLHGHPLTWGNRTWQHPDWIWEQFTPENEKAALGISRKELYKLSEDEIYARGSHFVDAYDRCMFERIRTIAERYKGRVNSWDVVNESSVDFHGNVEAGGKVCKSAYGLMPADYTLRSFRVAKDVFPAEVKLNINDYANNRNYVEQTKALQAAGCKIDLMGSQMHLFNPQQTLDMAAGKSVGFGGMVLTPTGIWNTMEMLSETGLPIHLSEITITAPNDDERGRQIQANVARDLYRMWFSVPNMMGITWWNVVDDCGAPGEPSTSGLFTRNMEPKPSFYALDQLINHQWRTNLTFQSSNTSFEQTFRGFKGKYRITWTKEDGTVATKEMEVR